MIYFWGLSHGERTISLLSPTLCSTKVLEEIRDQLVSVYKQRVKSSSWKESLWGSFWSRLLALLVKQSCKTNYISWFTTFCVLEENVEDPSGYFDGDGDLETYNTVKSGGKWTRFGWQEASLFCLSPLVHCQPLVPCLLSTMGSISFITITLSSLLCTVSNYMLRWWLSSNLCASISQLSSNIYCS